ncbi:MAG: cupin domain-containing protein [Acidobacteria bacterium]|nr:cupin domain-containing protein [Acidobacteriota bacterium]MBI3264974.1 cupin domain-containing protein [Acidobacteriota bacterium]
MDIGKRIKEFRLAHQLTQQELANRAGVTKGFISLLERNKSSVSLETLSEVLEVLGERISTFFSSDALQPFVFGRHDRTALADQGADKFELLIPGSTTMAMEPCRLVLGAGQRLRLHAAHSGEEFGYVIKGRVAVSLGRRSAVAKAGDAFTYKAQQEHSLQNVGRSAAEVLFVTWPPQF